MATPNTDTNQAAGVRATNPLAAQLHADLVAARAALARAGEGCSLLTVATAEGLEEIRSAAETLCDLIVMARLCGDQLGNDDGIAAECWRAMIAVTRAGLDFQYVLRGSAARFGLDDYAIG